jgi:hypothetical protein
VTKLLLLFPLAFVADVQGFALFAPYLAVFLPAALLLRRRRRLALPRVASRRIRGRDHAATMPTLHT